MAAIDDARVAAHRWAADARAAREALLDDLAAGRETLAGALERSAADPMIGRIELLCVLESLPGAGKVATRRRLEELGIDQRTPLADAEIDVIVGHFGVVA